ncbi:phosphatase PAP2 family protein [Plantactinospora sp. B6F1]|uniref:phosphatase PAP2 family protein n=1 Tax=Plantactinospora sp. B6F1 TaxID=3158971 RepID=UPI0032D979B7
MPVDRGPARRLRRAGLGYLLAFVLTAAGSVGTVAGQFLDGRLLPPRAERGGGYEQPTALVEPARSVLAWFGDPVVLGLLLVTVLLLAVLGRRLRAGVAGVGLVGAAVLGASVAKQLIPRPDLGVATSTTHNSFPSGHVAAATALLLAVLLVVPAPARPWCAVPGTVGVCTVAAATMIAGWHRFSDVLGGVLLAAALFCLAAAVLARSGAGAAAPAGCVTGPVTGLPGGVSLFGLFGLLGLGLLVGVPSLTPHATLGDTRGLFVAIAAGSGLVLLVVATILVLVRSADFAGPVPGYRPVTESDSTPAEARSVPNTMIDRAT